MKENENFKVEANNIEEDIVTEEDINAFMFFRSIEETMKCIHWTNAVDYCIAISVNDPYNPEGHFDIHKFNNGYYDNEDLLDKLYVDSEVFFEDYKDRFVSSDKDIFDYIKYMASEYKFSHAYRYLTGFVNYLNQNKLLK